MPRHRRVMGWQDPGRRALPEIQREMQWRPQISGVLEASGLRKLKTLINGVDIPQLGLTIGRLGAWLEPQEKKAIQSAHKAN